MKSNLVLGLVLLASFAAVPCLAQNPTPAPAGASPTNQSLQEELVKMGEEDQKLRAQLRAQMTGKTTIAREELAALWKEQEEIDRKNMSRLEEIIAQHGWPSKSLVGAKASTAAFLILQHADLKFLEKYFPLLKEAAGKGEADPADAAMMEDRVLMYQGKKQIYGTQLHSADGKTELYPIEDEANVDARRAAVGLPPLAEYLKHFGLEYKPPGN